MRINIIDIAKNEKIDIVSLKEFCLCPINYAKYGIINDIDMVTTSEYYLEQLILDFNNTKK